MKQILLMRHAKSSWEEEGLSDFERPLAKRGLQDAPKMGSFMKRHDWVPEQVVSSTAKRARQTTELCVKALGDLDDRISWNEDLYYGSIQDYIVAIQNVGEHAERVLLVGHNPLMENTAGHLSGSNQKTAIRMPTCALVCLESYASEWSMISPGSCQIRWMMIPKLL